MSDLVPSTLEQRMFRQFLDVREGVRLRCLLRKLFKGATWLPLVFVLGAIAGVGYADHLVVSISLVYLYILPLVISAVFLRREISYGLIPICILLHDYVSPRIISLALRIFHNGSALLCFFIVVYVIQRHIREKEVLAKTVQQQRDDLLHDVELAAQVQRMFLPSGKPAIAGLEIAGMMKPAKGLSGDYYDYIPINAHTLQTVTQLERFFTAKIAEIEAPASEDAGKPMAGKVPPFQLVE
jgi:hypothetical protein